jgi:hypothetical protein
VQIRDIGREASARAAPERRDNMRKTAMVVAIVILATCLFASGTARDTAKVYFTVGSIGDTGASQVWRCNRDGSEPELLWEGYELWEVEVDAATQTLFFTDHTTLHAADLDGTSVSTVGSSYMYDPPQLGPDVVFPVDAQGGYVCWAECGSVVHTTLADGSDSQWFQAQLIPDMVINAVVADVALYVVQGNAVESMSWGRIKSEYR